MSHSHWINNVVFVCNGDPRGSDVRVLAYPEGYVPWRDGTPNIEPLFEVKIPFNTMAEFVGRIALREKLSEIESMTGMQFLGLCDT